MDGVKRGFRNLRRHSTSGPARAGEVKGAPREARGCLGETCSQRRPAVEVTVEIWEVGVEDAGARSTIATGQKRSE